MAPSDEALEVVEEEATMTEGEQADGDQAGEGEQWEGGEEWGDWEGDGDWEEGAAKKSQPRADAVPQWMKAAVALDESQQQPLEV